MYDNALIMHQARCDPKPWFRNVTPLPDQSYVPLHPCCKRSPQRERFRFRAASQRHPTWADQSASRVNEERHVAAHPSGSE